MLIKLKVIFICFFIGLNVVVVFSNEITNRCLNLINPTKLKIETNIDNEGFHKNFNINIQINTDETDYFKTNCNLMILQKFNSNFYVDEFELRQNIYKQIFLFLLSKKINTESIEYRSEPFVLVLIIKKTYVSCNEQSNLCYVSFKYPFHLRYHAASDKSLNQLIHINTPKILVSDCNQDLTVQKEFIFNFDENFNKFLINDLLIKECFWTEIDQDYSMREFELNVPVGDANLTKTVLTITLAFLILLSLYVSKLFREKSLEFNKKAN